MPQRPSIPTKSLPQLTGNTIEVPLRRSNTRPSADVSMTSPTAPGNCTEEKKVVIDDAEDFSLGFGFGKGGTGERNRFLPLAKNSPSTVSSPSRWLHVFTGDMQSTLSPSCALPLHNESGRPATK